MANEPARILGIDLGSVTIGLALSDETGLIAHPHRTLRRRGSHNDIEQLAELVHELGVATIVVGLPRRLDGSHGPEAKQVLTFAEMLRRVTGLTVETWDERLSTVAATRALLEADVSRARRRRVVDQVAAALILQGYLDRRRTKQRQS